MATPLPSGINKFDDTDNVTNEAQNENFEVIDAAIRNYNEEVDQATYDSAAGVYTTVYYKRQDDTNYLKAFLSNKNVNGYYETDTWTIYAADGTTIVKTITWTLGYDAEGNLVSKSYAVS